MIPMSKMAEEVSMKIPERIFNRLKQRVESTGEFSTVDEYVAYILGQVVERLEGEKQEHSKEDEERIKQRLKNLGYLD